MYERNTRLNMFLFLHDHLVKLLNESLAQTRIDKDGIPKTGYEIRGNSYFELFDINIIMLICIIQVKRHTKLYQNLPKIRMVFQKPDMKLEVIVTLNCSILI